MSEFKPKKSTSPVRTRNQVSARISDFETEHPDFLHVPRPRSAETTENNSNGAMESRIETPHLHSLSVTREYRFCDCGTTAVAGLRATEYHSKIIDPRDMPQLPAQVGPLPIVCYICKKSFPTLSDRVAHLKNDHSQWLIFNCTICNGIFLGQEEYDTHKATHPLACQLCPLQFNLQAELDKHIKSHSKVKYYFACEYCTRLFNSKDQLLTHKMIHTGPNEDTTTTTSVISPPAAAAASTTVTEGLNLKCTICSASFSFTHELIGHTCKSAVPPVPDTTIRTKNLRAKPFNCVKCKKSYYLQPSLSFHVCNVKSKNSNYFPKDSGSSTNFILSA